MDVEQAKFVRCDENVSCHYVNGRVQAEEDESVREIARRYNLEETKLAWLNKIEHPTIMPTSKLVRGTLLLLPLHPTLMQRAPENAALKTAEGMPLPHLAISAPNGDSGDTVRRSSVEFVDKRGRMGTRHAKRVPRLLYGGMAVLAGACEELLGVRVAVDCVNARYLGTVVCYDAASSLYYIMLDAHGGAGGLGDVAAQPFCVATPLPCPAVHVIASMEASPKDDVSSPREDVSQLDSLASNCVQGKQVTASESSPDTPPSSAREHDQDANAMGSGSGISAAALTSLVGITVTRPFDGVSGKVSTLVPGSDVVIVEWEDGDCEDMHVTDMRRQGLL